MSEEGPRFNQLNLMVEDMDAALAFYQALGMAVRFDGGEWPPGSGARHVALDNGEGAIFELDNLAMARIWHGGWRSPDAEGRPVVLGFSLSSREEVDERYRALTVAGYASRPKALRRLLRRPLRRCSRPGRQRRRSHEPHRPAPALHTHDLTRPAPEQAAHAIRRPLPDTRSTIPDRVLAGSSPR